MIRPLWVTAVCAQRSYRSIVRLLDLHFFFLLFFAVPGASPRRVEVEVLNSTALKVMWRSVTPGKQNGQIRGYQVHYVRVENGESRGHPFIKDLMLADAQVWPSPRFPINNLLENWINLQQNQVKHFHFLSFASFVTEVWKTKSVLLPLGFHFLLL